MSVRIKNPLRRMICFVLALFFGVFSPVSSLVFAVDQTTLDDYSQNNVLFYEGGASCHGGGVLQGDTIMAKVVNYLKGNNPTGFVLSDNGIAGILANFEGESGFNPFRFQGDRLRGPAYGIAQFDPMEKILTRLRSDPRTANYYNEYFDLKYSKLDYKTGFPREQVPMEVIDAWLVVQLDYFFIGNNNFDGYKVKTWRNNALAGNKVMGLSYINDNMTAHEAMDAAKTPEDATRLFVWLMERPRNKEAASNSRSKNAQKWLSFTKAVSASSGNSGGSLSFSSSESIDGSNVTIIGDSITVSSASKIKELMPQADIHAQVSKVFGKGTGSNPGGKTILSTLINENKLRDILVFALGTNGSGLKEADVKEVVELAGDSRKVIFVTNYSESNSYTGNNNIFTKVKNDNKNVYIADWKGAVESNPSQNLERDGLHPNSEGQSLFASTIVDLIKQLGALSLECLDEGIVDGGLTEQQARRMAEYYNGPKTSVSEWALPFGKKNCVSFSKWFGRFFTGLPWGNGNGKDVAHNFAVKNNLKEGTVPRVFAIFSVTKGSLVCSGGYSCGHTGVVVAINGDDVMTIEAAYKSHDAQVRHRDVSWFENVQYGNTFVYLDSVIDQSKIKEVVGN